MSNINYNRWPVNTEVAQSVKSKQSAADYGKNAHAFRVGRTPFIEATAVDSNPKLTLRINDINNKDWDSRNIINDNIRLPRPGIVSMEINHRKYSPITATLKFNVFSQDDLKKFGEEFATPGRKILIKYGWSGGKTPKIDKGEIEGVVTGYVMNFLTSIGFGWEISIDIVQEGISMIGNNVFNYNADVQPYIPNFEEKGKVVKGGLYSEISARKQLIESNPDAPFTSGIHQTETDSGLSALSMQSIVLPDNGAATPGFALGLKADPKFISEGDTAVEIPQGSAPDVAKWVTRIDQRRTAVRIAYINLGYLTSLINTVMLSNVVINEFSYTWNHPDLKSVNPEICILGGDKKHLYGTEDEILQTCNEEEFALLEKFSDTTPEMKFNYGKFDSDAEIGNINGIYICTDFLLQLLENKTDYTLEEFLQDVFKGISQATGFLIKLNLIYKTTNVLTKKKEFAIVDSSFVGNEITKPEKVVFELGTKSLVRNVTTEFKLPNKRLQAAVLYGTEGLEGLLNSEGISTIWGNIFNSETKPKTPVSSITRGYLYRVYDHIRQNIFAPKQYIAIGTETLQKYLGTQNTSPYLRRMVTNLQYSVSVDGMEGIYPGNPIKAGTAVLPFRINKYFEFIVLEVSHQITDSDWETTYTTEMYIDLDLEKEA